MQGVWRARRDYLLIIMTIEQQCEIYRQETLRWQEASMADKEKFDALDRKRAVLVQVLKEPLEYMYALECECRWGKDEPRAGYKQRYDDLVAAIARLNELLK